ncbi:MAG: hypothetical protein ACRDMH_17645 [Solirubrobacterales bacterium]
MSAPIRYAKNGDINIAYKVLGEGPPDLIFVQGNITNLDIYWDDRRYREFCEGLAAFSRLILFDKRGMGLSDRVETGTMEDRMDLGVSLVSIVETAHVLRTGYSVARSDIIGVLLDLVAVRTSTCWARATTTLSTRSCGPGPCLVGPSWTPSSPSAPEPPAPCPSSPSTAKWRASGRDAGAKAGQGAYAGIVL